ncbi:MAG: alpha/beta fold hydrolase [Acidimicrobiales bacterium]
MATVTANGVTINYETFGDSADPTLLLVNGLGSQLINYEPSFCQLFVDRGFQVVVFDNRDVGLTSKSEAPVPDVAANMAKYRRGEPVTGTPYTLRDMANDGFAVLDAVGADAAHVAGMSMGGMIVQRMAIDQPERVLSMTSIMSTTGSHTVGGATPEAGKVLVVPPPPDRDGFIEHTVNSRRVTGGSHYSADYWREQAGRLYDRSFNPIGSAYQISAVSSDGDRTEELGSLSMPCLVIHGRLDPLIQLSGGEATAAAIPGSELLVIDSMGHDLPEQIWEEVVSAMCATAAKAS